MNEFKITVIGGGAMGGALASGLLRSGYPARLIAISSPHPQKLSAFEERGIKVTADNAGAAAWADLVVVAVKPRVLPEVIAGIAPTLRPRQEVCVIAASVSTGELTAMFPTYNTPEVISIAMPNTAMGLCKSMTFMVDVKGSPAKAVEALGRTGRVMHIEERLLPAATALASCGIAYAMRYVRAATEGGVELGFPAAQAQEIVAETIKGAAALLEQPGTRAETEIDRVTTPGGLTIRGLNAMEAAGFTAAVQAGLRASAK